MICSKSAVDFIRRASGILKVSGSNKTLNRAIEVSFTTCSFVKSP